MPKNHSAVPVPAIEVYARPLGKIKFVCPNCAHPHPYKFSKWRRADPACMHCVSKFRLGLGFSTEDRNVYGYLMGKWNGFTGNRLNPSGTVFDQAFVHGTIEWLCPWCLHKQESFLKDRSISCAECSSLYFVSLLIYKAVKTFKVRCPFDWVFPKDSYAPTPPAEPLSAAPSDPSAGTPSLSPGGDS